MNKKRALIAASIILSISSGIVVYAADQTARLKAGLQSDYLYYSVAINELNNGQAKDKKVFKNEYDEKYVVVTGEIKEDSVTSKGKELILYEPGTQQVATIDSSAKETIDIAKSLVPGNKITVYGKLAVTGFSDDGYEIVAKNISMIGSSIIPVHSYAYANGNSYNGKKIQDLTPDNRVTYYVPDTWENGYVKSALTNNDVKGYQYSLNAISPQNTDYPEIFYIFYFNYETYLEKPPKNPTDGDNEDIEEEIIRNILQDLKNDFKINISDIKDSNGTEFDYFATTYRPKDGNDYRLEFVFRPEEKGIICMLYLYYPKESAVKHVDDVIYVLETMETK